MDATRTFESKRDPALVALLLIAVGFVWFVCLKDARSPLAAAIALPIALLVTAFVLSTVLVCR